MSLSKDIKRVDNAIQYGQNEVLRGVTKNDEKYAELERKIKILRSLEHEISKNNMQFGKKSKNEIEKAKDRLIYAIETMVDEFEDEQWKINQLDNAANDIEAVSDKSAIKQKFTKAKALATSYIELRKIEKRATHRRKEFQKGRAMTRDGQKISLSNLEYVRGAVLSVLENFNTKYHSKEASIIGMKQNASELINGELGQGFNRDIEKHPVLG